MNILAKYIHGSKDSLDVDTCFIVDQLPPDTVCKRFCELHTVGDENPNIAEIKNGVLSAVYKGTIDEFNNSLRATYALHEQTHPMLLKMDLERDIFLKVIRVIRCILSYFSRTPLRVEIKKALRSQSLEEKLSVLKLIDLTQPVDFSSKANTPEDAYKVIAFQLGQVLALMWDGTELYTKSDVRNTFPSLTRYINREKMDFEFEASHSFKEETCLTVAEYEAYLGKIHRALTTRTQHTLQDHLMFFRYLMKYLVLEAFIIEESTGIYIYTDNVQVATYDLLKEIRLT